jgi:hypothetical protein
VQESLLSEDTPEKKASAQKENPQLPSSNEMDDAPSSPSSQQKKYSPAEEIFMAWKNDREEKKSAPAVTQVTPSPPPQKKYSPADEIFAAWKGYREEKAAPQVDAPGEETKVAAQKPMSPVKEKDTVLPTKETGVAAKEPKPSGVVEEKVDAPTKETKIATKETKPSAVDTNAKAATKETKPSTAKEQSASLSSFSDLWKSELKKETPPRMKKEPVQKIASTKPVDKKPVPKAAKEPQAAPAAAKKRAAPEGAVTQPPPKAAGSSFLSSLWKGDKKGKEPTAATNESVPFSTKPKAPLAKKENEKAEKLPDPKDVAKQKRETASTRSLFGLWKEWEQENTTEQKSSATRVERSVPQTLEAYRKSMKEAAVKKEAGVKLSNKSAGLKQYGSLAIIGFMLTTSALFGCHLLVGQLPAFSKASDGLCAPIMPGRRLSSEEVVGVAPWWVPEQFKEPSYRWLCKSVDRPLRARLKWTEQKPGVHRLDVVNIDESIGAIVMSKKRLHSAQIWTDHIVLSESTKKDGIKVTTVEAPWKKQTSKPVE